MLNQAHTIEPKIALTPSRHMNILVLDDSEVDRKRILRLCTDAGLTFVPTEVPSIAEMQQALAAESFDLVLIDHMLVGENGLDAIDVLTDDPDQTAVSIMIAGEARIDVAVEAMRRGCSDYLIKSKMSPEALQKSVATALERRMMGFALREEREKRQKLELAVRRYANACSVEMRTILAATLRRVRKLRSMSMSNEHASQLGDLEDSIDKLWDALPQFGEQAAIAMAEERDTRGLINSPTGVSRETH